MDRNSRPAFAALSAEEERRRANEEAASRHALNPVFLFISTSEN